MLPLLSEDFVRVLGGKTSAWEATVVIFFPFLEQNRGRCCIPYVAAAAESGRHCPLPIATDLVPPIVGHVPSGLCSKAVKNA